MLPALCKYFCPVAKPMHVYASQFSTQSDQMRSSQLSCHEGHHRISLCCENQTVINLITICFSSSGKWNELHNTLILTDEVIGFFSLNLHNPPSRTLALGLTQPVTELSTRNFPGNKVRPVCNASDTAAICEPNV
jgi:hypothetical protein